MARLTIEKIDGKFRIGNGIPMSGEIFISEMFKFANSPENGEREIPVVQPAMPVVFSRHRIQPEILARFREIATKYPHTRIAKVLGVGRGNIRYWVLPSWDGGYQSPETLQKLTEFVRNFDESILHPLSYETMAKFVKILKSHSIYSVSRKVGLKDGRLRVWARRTVVPYLSESNAEKICSFVKNYNPNDPELRPAGHRYKTPEVVCTPK